MQLQCALPALALIPERLVLREAVSQPSEMLLDTLSTSRHFELKRLIGEQVTVSLLQPDDRYQPWHGYVFEAAQLGADGGLARYRLVLRPWLSFLALRSNAHIFQDQTAAEVLQAVFADYAVAHFELKLSEPLRQRSLCTRYNETDLCFASRLLAEEGLSYRFEQLDDAAAATADRAGHARHKLIITDRYTEIASRPALGTLRFTHQHPTANKAGQKDAITAFAAARHLQTNAVAVGSWNYRELQGTATETNSALSLGELPTLEAYDGAGAYRFDNSAHAQRAAELALTALELNFKRFEGQGSARHLVPGGQIDLIDHPLYGANRSALNYAGQALASHQRGDNQFSILAVEHHASNNLGAQMAQLLASTDLEAGTYKNHFHAAPAAAAVVPRSQRKPSAWGLQTALVMAVAGEPLSTDRDLRVKIQFPWQRGDSPLAGGLNADPASNDPSGNAPANLGNAPGNERSGTWVRVALPSAGANWGSAFVPRVGTEVAVQFIEGDIDRPLVLGQLYNGADTPPFAAGVDSGVNHPGVLSGLHSQALDGAGFNQWVLDDATGQLRMRLLTSAASVAHAEAHLGHLIQQGPSGAQRGPWRGSGFELASAGWASLRAGKGMLISTTPRPGSYGSAQGSQMDSAEALGQLQAARELGQQLHQATQTAGAQGIASHSPGQALEQAAKAIDPQQQGKHPGSVNGQSAMRAAADGRSEGDQPVPAFGRNLLLLDTPSTLAWATQASVMTLAGQHTSITAASDIQQTAAHTHASVSGGTTSLYTHQGGAKVIAANGPASLRAHTDALQIWADQEVTVVSVNDEIRIQASSRIEITGGQSQVVLEGGNVTFSCPGKFEVKSATHAFLGGGSAAAELSRLPDSTVKFYDEAFILKDPLGKPLQTMPYKLTAPDGVEKSASESDGKSIRVSTAASEKLKFELRWFELDAKSK